MPDLETPRLTLRALTVSEATVLADGELPGGFAFGDGYPMPDTRDGAKLFLRHGVREYGFHLLVRREDGQVVGEIGFVGPPRLGVVTIGYAVVPTARRQGFATEAIEALTAWAVAQPGVGEVRAQTLPDNEPSIRALLGAGYTEEEPLEKVRRFTFRAAPR